ncbi:hypothetical protein Rsub_03889 [Raphidocelis subcapitata]|uniref:Uncharacterized protein n=1 Tax=Raphidocelis subcapitata TaxID=307507 RepID=A0A2V0NTS3_9CHLO|nr:hypothetical protein Rsub_03889 [Raphidocelis subcapitata]|eukprot:GBF91034.1 hypothetical protein Rsub_03889 [Raphidocelis subcapitata]
MGAPEQNDNRQPDEVGGHTPSRSGAATPGRGAGAGADANVAALAEATGVDYEWLAEQLTQLGAQLGGAALVDELEDDFEEWRDPSDGLLSAAFAACEAGAAAELAPLLPRLAEGGWSLDTPGPDGDTALHVAALYGSAACAGALLAAGARVDALNPEDGTSALHDAAAGGYTAILEALARAARRQLAPLDGGGGGGEGAAAAAAAAGGGGGGGGAGAAAALGALVNARDEDGETALHCAARGGHAAAVSLLLGLGADPRAAAHGGALPVDEADDAEVISLLRAAMGGGGGGESGSGDGSGDGSGGSEGRPALS